MRWYAMAAALVAAALGPWASRAGADGFSETFDSGSATFTVNDPYWLDQTLANGYVIQSTTQVGAFPFGAAIPADASGSGYFLFEGTAAYPGTGNIPPGHDQFYISPTFAVTANTLYNVSFEATDANGINNPSLQAEIDGSLLGSPVSPVGTYTSNGWQTFTFSWNSGANTSASLILHDFTQAPTGNDFGVDNIVVGAVPEPSSLALAGLGLGLVAFRRLRRRADR